MNRGHKREKGEEILILPPCGSREWEKEGAMLRRCTNLYQKKKRSGRRLTVRRGEKGNFRLASLRVSAPSLGTKGLVREPDPTKKGETPAPTSSGIKEEGSLPPANDGTLLHSQKGKEGNTSSLLWRKKGHPHYYPCQEKKGHLPSTLHKNWGHFPIKRKEKGKRELPFGQMIL